MGLPLSKPQLPTPAQENCLTKLLHQSYAQPVLAALTLFDLTQLERVSKQLSKLQPIHQEKYRKILQSLTCFILHPNVQQQHDCPSPAVVQAILAQKTNLQFKINSLIKVIKISVDICVFAIQQCIYREELINYEADIILAPDGGLIPAWNNQQSMFKSALARQILLIESHPLQFILDCPILFTYFDNRKLLKKLRNIRQAFKLRAAAENNNFSAVELLQQENIDINFASKNIHGNFPATAVREPDAGEFPDTGCPLVGAIINNHKTMVLWLLDIGVYVSPAKKHLLEIVLGSDFLFNVLPQHVITAHLSCLKLEWHPETIQQVAGIDLFKECLLQVIQEQARVHRLQLWQAVIDPKSATLISKLFHTQLGNYLFPDKGQVILDKAVIAYQADRVADSIADQRRAALLTSFFPQFNNTKLRFNPKEILLSYCGLPQVKCGMQL